MNGVVTKFGVKPESIPDGRKSTAKLLARYVHLEAIPPSARDWDVAVGGFEELAHVLEDERDRAFLFRTLATLRTDIELSDDVESLRYGLPAPK